MIRKMQYIDSCISLNANGKISIKSWKAWMRSQNNLARGPRSPSVRKKNWLFRERNLTYTLILWQNWKNNKIQMNIRLISVISSQSTDVVNTYITFRLLVLIKWTTHWKNVENWWKSFDIDFLRVRLRHKISRHIESAIYIWRIACNRIKL